MTTRRLPASRPIVATGAAVLALALSSAGCAQVNPQDPGVLSPRPGASTTTSGAPTSVTPSASGTPATPTCASVVAGLSPSHKAGQVVMTAVTGSLGADEKALLGRGLGSVILMGQGQASVEQTAALTKAIRSAGTATGVLVAVDQEGGKVQRLSGPGFDRIPSAAQQATLTPPALKAQAEIWGGQLADAGVHLTFAPVADVVPAAKTASNAPIGALGRGYGSTTAEVAPRVAAFIEGMHAAGVGTSAKHFPNLGEVTGNTDFTADVVDTATKPTSPSLGAFRAAIEADTETVMLATAMYSGIDPGVPAAFSSKVIALLRADLGFEGVIVSDDLGAAEMVQKIPVGERGVRFLKAGGDLAVVVDAAAAGVMADAIATAAKSDPALAQRVEESAVRVLELKAHLGALTCTPAAKG